MEYVGDSFIFWYGPYENKDKVIESDYKLLKEDGDIRLLYDSTNPENNSLDTRSIDQKYNKCIWCTGSIFIYGCFGGMIFGLERTWNGLEEGPNIDWMLCIALLPSICIALGFILFRCFRNKIFCFAQNESNKLNCAETESIDDHLVWFC